MGGDSSLCVLAALAASGERHGIAEILRHTNWSLTFASDFHDTRRFIRRPWRGVVISDVRLPGGAWQDILAEIHYWRAPAALIVVALDDNAELWAEVLNLGAQDVLVKPFDPDAVLRAVSSAWRQVSMKSCSPMPQLF